MELASQLYKFYLVVHEKSGINLICPRRNLWKKKILKKGMIKVKYSIYYTVRCFINQKLRDFKDYPDPLDNVDRYRNKI